jgi:putative acetyltransferase
MHLAYLIRHERDDDIPGIRTVVHDAFEKSGEADLVDALRAANALTVSAVAVSAEKIIAHVGFSPITIGGKHEALALAPVSVAPAFQGRGVGKSMVHWALDECQRDGHEIVVVLGSPKYYGRFGFVPASSFGIECPFPVPSDHFMVLELTPDAARDCSGMVQYRPEFSHV